MLREHGKYIASVLIAIALIVFVTILIVKSFSGTPVNDRKDITDYISSNSSMEVTAYGPIVSDEKYESVRISVSSQEVKIDLMRGYDNTVVAGKTYINNGNAYDEFVRSLSILNYAHGNDNKKLADEKGFCPTGKRFAYVIKENGEQVQRYWSASCNKGTFGGSPNQVRALFRAQVPDYGEVIRSVPNFTNNF